MSAVKNMQALQSGRNMASAEVLWQALETQRDCGINWQVLEAMDDSLARLLPFTRHTVKTRTREGLFLLNVYRKFCPVKCEHMLNVLEFPDVMQWLNDKGYKRTHEEFLRRACSYASAQQSLIYYAR